MKLYVVLGGHDYEGYASPLGVFSTPELAEECAEAAKGYDFVDIDEYELDKAGE